MSRLAKKYPSLIDEIAKLISSLELEPCQGKSLGRGLYKIRVRIKSKGQGKSGGARVITFVKVVKATVVLGAIYDKATQETMTNDQLDNILNKIY